MGDERRLVDDREPVVRIKLLHGCGLAHQRMERGLLGATGGKRHAQRLMAIDACLAVVDGEGHLDLPQA